MSLSSTAKGYIAEKIIGNLILTASQGVLVPYLPVIDDAGVDLIVYSKRRNRVLRLQVKSRFSTLRRHPNNVHFEVRRKVFRASQNLFIVCTFIDAASNVPSCSWLIPSVAFGRGARWSAKKLVIRPSVAVASRDRWSAYRCLTPTTLIRGLSNRI
ncbi:MAG: hypothetical protein HY923_10340 [Elusimicrobia bacterium]|nr:hypothetical protein [Elusimicrobiota bacterium]